MKRKNFTRAQVNKFLSDIAQAHEQGMTIAEACAAIGISEQSYYRHKALRKAKPKESTSKPQDTQSEADKLRVLVVSLMETMIKHGLADTIKVQ